MQKKYMFSIIKAFRHFFRDIRRMFYGRKIDSHPSIIANDCCGGVIYNNLGLCFTSPTIKLYINNDDFLLFCKHIEDFIESEMEYSPNNDFSYPVGELKCEHGIVKVNFMHYESFESAKSCWERRKIRIDFKNIFVLMNAGPNVNEDILKEFSSLKYNKVLLSSGINTNIYSDCLNLDCYEKGFKGPLVKYRSSVSPIRYLDEYKWLNIFK